MPHFERHVLWGKSWPKELRWDRSSWGGGGGGGGGGGRWGGIDVRGTRKEDVWFDVNQVGAPPPHILSVINDGHHRVPTREYRPVCGCMCVCACMCVCVCMCV